MKTQIDPPTIKFLSYCMPLLIAAGLLVGGCEKPGDSKDQAATGDNSEPADMAPTRAKVGVGKSSRNLDYKGPQRMVASPAATLFRTKEKIVFEIQIPHALNLYKALKGKGPQSHDEFMKSIIQANNIKLPELPQGQHYEFNVEKQELWVHPDETNDDSPTK